MLRRTLRSLVALALGVLAAPTATAEHGGPHLLDPRLGVRTVVEGLNVPTSLAFLGADDILVLEKDTGRVMRVIGGVVQSVPALDLGVNSASERGLLGITLHPRFPARPFVYLYWTCRGTPQTEPFMPAQTSCDDPPPVGADTADINAVPLLGNRVDRFVWDGETLSFERNIVELRAFQDDGGPEPPGQGDDGQPARGNHDGGIVDFGPDGKLYIIVGDVGRRGNMQNLPCGPTATCPGPVVPDDQFGGPEPDDAHLTSVILRLNANGTTPSDNPFFSAGAAMGGEVGANVQQIFAYGLRNTFGMAFDPISGALWEQENGDDTFTELNRVEPGFNSGWIQIMGPAGRVAQYREIETTFGGRNLQQLRWPPANIATTPTEARGRLFMLPGAHFSDPEFSWKFEVAPAGIGFVEGRGLGPSFEGDLFVAAARPTLEGGHLFHFNLTGNRRKIAVEDPSVEDRVADNLHKFDITESEEFLIGTDFGIGADVETGPNGNLFIVSLTHGAIYEIFRV